jgi:hypothetical protein
MIEVVADAVAAQRVHIAAQTMIERVAIAPVIDQAIRLVQPALDARDRSGAPLRAVRGRGDRSLQALTRAAQPDGERGRVPLLVHGHTLWRQHFA